MLTMSDLLQAARSQEMRDALVSVWRRMAPSRFISEALLATIESDAEYVSFRTVMGAYSRMARPFVYVEIGTRRGHSACMVAHCAPRTEIHCFDLFVPFYGNEENSQALVESELRKFNCKAIFHVGDSKVTVPEFFRQSPENPEMVLVDGDHSPAGALADLQNVVGRIGVGGLLVFDDLCDPSLGGVWSDFMKKHPNFDHHEDTKHENGFGVALRVI